MTDFLINGAKGRLPLEPTAHLSELMETLRRKWNSETTAITSVKLDGEELGAEGEERLRDVPVSTFGKIEIMTAHPREIAEDTLQMLLTFTEGLEGLSRSCSTDLSASGEQKFLKFVEGMGTFHEALATLKRILRLEEDSRFSEIVRHEAALLALLKQLLESKQNVRTGDTERILGDLLPKELAVWRSQLIPSIIQGRSS